MHNSEWGPYLWLILHLCAERCGRQTLPMLHIDEVRAWVALLKITEAILPCPLCQNHYRAWLKANPIAVFLTIRSPAAFAEAAQLWVWRLHNSINRDRGVEEMTAEDAKALYSSKTSADMQQALDRLLNVLAEAKLQRLIDGIYTREWRGKLSLLRRLLGV